MNNLVNILIKRSDGARKIAVDAMEHNNDLTAWHFSVKPDAYNKCIKIIILYDRHVAKTTIFNLFNALISNIPLNDKRKFQEIMGIAEVYGEVLTLL